MLTQDTAEGWLTESYDYEPPHRGEVRKGVILSLEAQGITVDVGLKRGGKDHHLGASRARKLPKFRPIEM